MEINLSEEKGSLFEAKHLSQSQIEEIRVNFNKIDKNKDGFIDREELRKMLMQTSDQFTDKHVDSLISAADVNLDGKIDFEEFCKVVQENIQ